MPWLWKFRSFANDLRSRSPESSINGSQPPKNRRILKLSTPTDSGKPKVVTVDEEFRQSMSLACFNTRLCPQCEALKLGERFAEAFQSSDDFTVWPQFSGLLPTFDESCDFCQFFKSLFSQADSTGNIRCFEVQFLNDRHCLVLKSWELWMTKYGKVSGFSDVRLLRGENGPGLKFPEIWPVSPFGVDYEELHKKLALCDDRNRRKQPRRLPPPPHPIFVINCDNRQIEVLRPEMKYVCLSYVWGPPRPSSGENRGFGYLPNPAERTVEDAITVTSKLHYRYIWVDKYCIDQENDEMKMAQIQQMDSIYAQADLTIIAAAGDHSDYGLPGVSTRPRSSRRSLKLGNYVLMACWKELGLANTLKQSKWMERGWTFQEALLSRRRLFFTEYCYLHDCGECHIEGNESMGFESWAQSPELVNHGRTKDTSRWMSYNLSITMPYVSKRIEEYSRRNLSHQSDALNAIAGILHTFELSNPPIYHHHGVPILPPSTPLAEPLTNKMDGFVQSLRWSLSLLEAKKRRSDFPSWSWVGWESPCYYLDQNTSLLAPLNVNVEIELRSGARIDWEEFEEKTYLTQDQSKLSHYIWVEAWTFTLETLDAPPPFHENVQRAWLVRNEAFEMSRYKASVQLFCKDSVEDKERLRAKCEAGKVVAVVLGDINKELPTRAIIIVEELDGFYQRVGNLDDNDFSLLFDIAPSFWERDIVKLERKWVRLS